MHDVNVSCDFRITCVEARLDKLEEKLEKRSERDLSIEKAIIEIQLSNQLISKTLSKLEEKFEVLVDSRSGTEITSNEKWMKLVEKVVYALIGVIGALIGVKLL